MKHNLRKFLYQLCRCMLFITVCGCIGWVYETIFTSILWGHFCGFFARGLLHVPVCPIYGFFALLLLAIFRTPLFRKLSGWKKAAAAFLTGTAVCTLCELLASYGMEAILGEFLWSYDGWPLNFQGRISLFSSLLFGALTLVLVFGVTPLFRRTIACQPKAVTILLGAVCGTVMAADLYITL